MSEFNSQLSTLSLGLQPERNPSKGNEPLLALGRAIIVAISDGTAVPVSNMTYCAWDEANASSSCLLFSLESGFSTYLSMILYPITQMIDLWGDLEVEHTMYVSATYSSLSVFYDSTEIQ